MLKKAMVAMLALAILAGCSFGGKGSDDGAGGQRTLRVVHYDEGSFYQQYGKLFDALYKVDIQVIPLSSLYSQRSDEPIDYEKVYYDLIENEKPDIVMLDTDRFKKMAEENKLANLDTYIANSKLDMEGYVPGIIDYIKELGNGSLYGMASEFNSEVLFYNKDLFDKYNVPYPTDKMTWEQVFQLARQFPTDGEPKDRVYGLKFGYSKDLLELAMQLAVTEQLQLVNGASMNFSINTDGWKKVFGMASEMMEADVLFYEQDRYQSFESGDGVMVSTSIDSGYFADPFVGGRLAMSLSNSYYLSELKRVNESINEEERLLKNWDIVTAPVNSQNPEVGSGVSLYNILAIPADAANIDVAWDFIQYVTSDEFARVTSKSNYSSSLPIRKEYIKGEGSYNYEALYALKPSTNQLYRNVAELSNDFVMNFYTDATEAMQRVTSKEIDLNEALDQLQIKMEQRLADSANKPQENEDGSNTEPNNEQVTE